MRVYDETVDVRVHPAGPVAFLWRQRLYVVRAVLGRWRERDDWWRREAVRLTDGIEHVVWRVEASRGRTAGTGVFDLAEPVPVAASALVPAGPAAHGPAAHGPAVPVQHAEESPSVVGPGWRLLRAVD